MFLNYENKESSFALMAVCVLALAACSDTVSWYKADVEIGDTGGEMSYYCDEIK